ncbi:hypothetical protein LLE87_31305, partial [Paenibacillus polymyxa]|nr:hypothetical protein [Paenibacillus polymyxa]
RATGQNFPRKTIDLHTSRKVHLTGETQGRIRRKDVNSHIPSQDMPDGTEAQAPRTKYCENIRNHAEISWPPKSREIWHGT